MSKYNNDLLNAVKDGSIDKVNESLKNGADVNTKTPDGITALMIAAQNGKMKIINILLEKGAEVNAKTPDCTTALIRATEYCKISAVKRLLEKGADVNTKTQSGKTSLLQAVKYCNTDMVLYLLQNGADIDDIDQDTAAELANDKSKSEVCIVLEKAYQKRTSKIIKSELFNQLLKTDDKKKLDTIVKQLKKKRSDLLGLTSIHNSKSYNTAKELIKKHGTAAQKQAFGIKS
jgi:ankyrin repeat protein